MYCFNRLEATDGSEKIRNDIRIPLEPIEFPAGQQLTPFQYARMFRRELTAAGQPNGTPVK